MEMIKPSVPALLLKLMIQSTLDNVVMIVVMEKHVEVFLNTPPKNDDVSQEISVFSRLKSMKS